MVTYGLFFLSSILAAHEKIEAALSSKWSAGLVRALYWILPKTAQLGQAVVTLVSDGHSFRRAPALDPFAVYGTTALFALVSLALASWLFSRKDF